MPEEIYRFNAHKKPFSFPKGTIIHKGNFSQDTLFVCKDEIIVHGGNWENVELPNATIIGGWKPRRNDYCYWLHGEDSESPKDLPVEPDNCRHVTKILQFDTGPDVYVREDITIW